MTTRAPDAVDPPAAPPQPACGAACGVTRERARQQDAARALANRAYPRGVWTAVPAWRPDEPPVARDELASLAAELAELLPVRAFVRASDDGCDAIDLLAGLHAPCWLEAREADGAPEGLPERETYLRVLLSPLGRYYTLQEVRLAAERDAAAGVWLAERRIAGVEDRRLQMVVKGAQGLLRRRKLVALDAAFLAEPATDDDDGAVRAAIGVAPTLFTLLFERAPHAFEGGAWLAGA